VGEGRHRQCDSLCEPGYCRTREGRNCKLISFVQKKKKHTHTPAPSEATAADNIDTLRRDTHPQHLAAKKSISWNKQPQTLPRRQWDKTPSVPTSTYPTSTRYSCDLHLPRTVCTTRTPWGRALAPEECDILNTFFPFSGGSTGGAGAFKEVGQGASWEKGLGGGV